MVDICEIGDCEGDVVRYCVFVGVRVVDTKKDGVAECGKLLTGKG